MDAASQTIFNIVFGVAGALAGWWMKSMWDAIKDLQKTDTELANRVNSLHILVAGDYVKSERLERITTQIFSQLDRIEGKMDKKVDKET